LFTRQKLKMCTLTKHKQTIKQLCKKTNTTISTSFNIFHSQVKTFRALVLHEASKEAKKFHGTVEETVCHDLKPPCLPREKKTTISVD
jgi:hypothetical protein